MRFRADHGRRLVIRYGVQSVTPQTKSRRGDLSFRTLVEAEALLPIDERAQRCRQGEVSGEPEFATPGPSLSKACL